MGVDFGMKLLVQTRILAASLRVGRPGFITAGSGSGACIRGLKIRTNNLRRRHGQTTQRNLAQELPPDCNNQSTMTVPSRLQGIYSQVDGMDHCSELLVVVLVP
jgi:hypothetical protein